MMKKPRVLNFSDYIKEAEGAEAPTLSEPVGLAVLGAPAGGKSYAVKKLTDIANDSRVERTLAKGVTLTVDKLRDEFLSKEPIEQLRGFANAFYLMKQKAAGNEKEFGKWYIDIAKLWSDKFSKIMPELNVTVEDGELLFDGKPALQNLSALDKLDSKGLIDKLDKYNDYKRVVRYFQDIKQEDAVQKKLDVSYDESGDEPTKIVGNMDKLHKQGYVTDVFLIHPENVASNLVQNFFRVVTGGDGGRDSSASIIGAYREIEKNKGIYQDNAEEVVKVKSQDIADASPALKRANVQDDKPRGDKPIDLFVEVQPMEPETAYKTFSDKLNPEQKEIFKAFLKFAAYNLKDIPEDAKKKLEELTKDMKNSEALEVLKAAADSKKYVFKYGGVTPELVAKAEELLK
jgi:hypothetical protein